MNERPERCENCRFWDDVDDAAGRRMDGEPEKEIRELYGFCRRYPPKMAVEIGFDDGREKTEGMWPWTNIYDWCGEFQPKEPSAD